MGVHIETKELCWSELNFVKKMCWQYVYERALRPEEDEVTLVTTSH